MVRLRVIAALALLAIVASCSTHVAQDGDPNDARRAVLLLFPSLLP